MATLEQILNYRNLTGVVRAIKSGIPNPLPDSFFKVGRRFSGNKGEYFKINGTRQLARVVQYGAPAKRRELLGVTDVPIILMHSFESQQWPLAMTIALTKMSELSKDNMGEEQANYQSAEFKRLFSNTRIAATMMALFAGKIFVDSAGNILPTSTGAAYTIDFGMAANNQNQCNSLIGTTWSNAAAPIMSDLLNLQKRAAQLTGYEIKHAFYGGNVPNYIASNTLAEQYLIRNPGMNQKFLDTGLIPNGFGGIENWHYVGKAFFNDKNGTNQSIGSISGGSGTVDDMVTFTPEPSPDWFEIMEGSFPVPTSIVPQMGADAATMLGNVSEQFGMFSYAQLAMNPPQVEQFAGDTFLPVLKVPDSVFQAIVKF